MKTQEYPSPCGKYIPVRERTLSRLTGTQRGYIRAAFRLYAGDMGRILLELSALRYCSLETALRSAVRDGCLTKQEAQKLYKKFNQEVAELPTRSVEYITALASGYNAGVKYDEIAAYVGKPIKTVLNDLYSLRKGTTTRHLFKGNNFYGKPANTPYVRVKGPVPGWTELTRTPFSEASEPAPEAEEKAPTMLPNPRGVKGGYEAVKATEGSPCGATGESLGGETPPSRTASVPPPLSGEARMPTPLASPNRGGGPSTEVDGGGVPKARTMVEGFQRSLTEGAGGISQLEELINGGAAFLSALPHGDTPRGLPTKAPSSQQNCVTIAAGTMTVTIGGDADITIHIKGGNNNV